MGCKVCGAEKRFGQFWPDGLCPKCEAERFMDRQRQAAAGLAGEIQFDVTYGGSGRWIAWRITGGNPDRPSVGLPAFVGHVPRRAEQKEVVIRRQIERAWRQGEFAQQYEVDAAPRGGSSFRITVSAPRRPAGG